MAVFVQLSLSAQEPDSINQVHDNTQLEYSVDSDTTRHPLKPPNTMSPRATLGYFISSMNHSYQIIMKEYDKSLEEPGMFMSDEIRSQVLHAERNTRSY